MFHIKMEDCTYGKVSCKAKPSVQNTNVYCQDQQNVFNLPIDNNAGGFFLCFQLKLDVTTSRL